MKSEKNRLITLKRILYCATAIAVFASSHATFAQKGDLGALLKEPPPISNRAYIKSTPPGCTVYKIYITTGDVEGADSDAKISLTMKGEFSALDRIEISGGSWERPDGRPEIREFDFCTVDGEPKTYVRWGADDETLPRTPQLFRRNTTTEVTISTTSLGAIERIILQHDNWYPNWLVTNIRMLENGREILNRSMQRWFRQDSLTKILETNPTSFRTDYNFDIYTGDVYQAGTNSNVYVTLNGDGGRVYASLDLNRLIPGNPFERNKTDSFGLYDREWMELRSITVSVTSGRWFLGSIKAGSLDYNQLVFRHDDWVEAGKPVTIYARSWQWERTRKVTFRNEAGYMARMMIQYTIDEGAGGTRVRTVSTPDMPVGQNSVLEIPVAAKNSLAFLIGVGTVNDQFYVNNFVGYLSEDPCLKAWGTIFSPQGGTCSGSPVATTLKNPYPTEAERQAENERSCLDLSTYQAGLSTENAKRLCVGNQLAGYAVLCYAVRIQDISSDDSIAECNGAKKFGSTPSIPKTKPATATLPTKTANPQTEQDCFNLVQGKVAYDTNGNSTWNDDNIKNLCRGTTNPTATIDCFKARMPQVGWSQASQECAAAASQMSRTPKMPVPTVQSGSNLEGEWAMYDDKGVRFEKLAKISQRGSNLSINNGYGSNSTAAINGSTFTTSDGLVGTISSDGTRIDWNIKFWWVKETRQTTPTVSTPVAPVYGLGTARDIDAKNGNVWIIGTTSVPGGFGIFKFNGSGWTQIDGGATRIAVDNGGNPWIVNADGTIFQRVGNQWNVIPGMPGTPAVDIAVARNGVVWVATTSGLVAGWNGSSWTIGRAMNANRVVAVPGTDTIQAVETTGRRWTRESEESWLIAPDPTGLADGFAEFAVDTDGTRWGIDSSFNIKRSGGNPIVNNIVGERELRPASTITTAATPTQRSVTFRNESGFVAKLMIQYFEPGPNGITLPKFVMSDDVPLGQSRTLTVPASVPNTNVMVYIIGTATTKDQFFNTTLEGTFTGNRCYKAWGTLFSPQGGGCDQ